MVVKNDFPNADKVLRKLKYLTEHAKKIKETSNDEIQIKRANRTLDFIKDYIDAISNYLDSVCNADKRIQKKRERTDNKEDLQYFVEEEDRKRTNYHNSIIDSMCMVDRSAVLLGEEKPFDYAEEYTAEYSPLIVSSIEAKKKMTERDRVKRREMGNFGLYIAASITAGLEMDDREVRSFASCESDNIEVDPVIYNKIVEKSHNVKANMNKAIE